MKKLNAVRTKNEAIEVIENWFNQNITNENKSLNTSHKK